MAAQLQGCFASESHVAVLELLTVSQLWQGSAGSKKQYVKFDPEQYLLRCTWRWNFSMV